MMHDSGLVSRHRLKLWVVAAIVVLTWFIWTPDLAAYPSFSSDSVAPEQSHEDLQEQPPLPSQTPAQHDDGLRIELEIPAPTSAVVDKDYCEHYRLQPFEARQNAPKRKVYDLLLVNTELEMLEIRMGQMAPDVDYFVILESDRTFTDKPKPLFVQENWDRFEPWHSKMIRRTMDLSGDFALTWDREHKSRNAMFEQVIPYLEGDEEAFEDDVLLVSDVDEIPKTEILKALRNCAFPQRTTLHAKNYYYSYQWMQRGDWGHPQATTYRGEDTILPEDLRTGQADHHFYEAAWHCSYCFSTIAEMVNKITSFSHTEVDKPEFKDPSRILHRVQNGLDAFDRADAVYKFDRIEANKDVPAFVLQNKDRYSYLLDRDAPGANFRDWNETTGQ